MSFKLKLSFCICRIF